MTSAKKDTVAKRLLSALLSVFIFCTTFTTAFVLTYDTDHGDIAFAAPLSIDTEKPSRTPALISRAQAAASAESSIDTEDYSVQAVLSPRRQTVIASGLDARIIKLNFESGDVFKEGDTLVEYDCAVDRARLREAQSRQRLTQKQLEAYGKLRKLDSVSEMEYVVAKENDEQNKALADQIRGRISLCKHIAPFNGRVMRKMASLHEQVQNGRVLMEISSREPLRAEFLIPSKWLRWLNIGTPLRIAINETERSYQANIVVIHGEVDPVSQSIQVVAEMEAYFEELLPGMSGSAIFQPQVVREEEGKGFLGLMLKPMGMEGDEPAEK